MLKSSSCSSTFVLVRRWVVEHSTANVLIDPALLAARLRVSDRELARAAGLHPCAVSAPGLATTDMPARLNELASILECIEPWVGSLPRAFDWYRTQPLTSFGGQTAEDLVKAGRAEHVRGYLARIAAGGYA
jgi:hypothetical protein